MGTSFPDIRQESYDDRDEFGKLFEEVSETTSEEHSPAHVSVDSSSESFSTDATLSDESVTSCETTSSEDDGPVLEIPADVPILLRKDITKGSLLGSGGFGEAYKGSLRLSDGTEAAVAIKEFSNRHALRNALHEACMLRDVAGIAGAPRLYGIITEEEPISIVMEFCRGQTFHEFMRKAYIAETSLVIQMMRRAVDNLHMIGVAHYDIHENNVLVDNTSSTLTIRFIDFGLAKKFTDDEEDNRRYQNTDKEDVCRLEALSRFV